MYHHVDLHISVLFNRRFRQMRTCTVRMGVWLLAGVLCGQCLVDQAAATVYNWVGGSYSNKWHYGANWDQNAIPGKYDNVIVGDGKLVDIFDTTAEARAYDFQMGSSTFDINGNKFRVFGGDCLIGTSSTSSATVNVNAYQFSSEGQNTLIGYADSSVVEFNLNGGTFKHLSDLAGSGVYPMVLAHGVDSTVTFTMGNALLNAFYKDYEVIVGGGGTAEFIQNGGTVTTRNLVMSGYDQDGSSGTYTLDADATLLLGDTGVGGTLTVGKYRAGTFIIQSDYATLEEADTSDVAFASDIVVGQTATATGSEFRGYGEVRLDGTLTNNGKVIADGMGSEQKLEMLKLAGVANTIDNVVGGSAGWYAINGGRLKLPTFDVAANDTIYWGDDDLDLINSAKIVTHDVTGGSLSVQVLATDRADVASEADTLTAWGFVPVTFDMGTGAMDVQFRYDDVLAASMGADESALRLYQKVGDTWSHVTTSLDTTNKLIGAEGITAANSIFAIRVGWVPNDCSEAITMGFGLGADLNSDCYVEWADFGIFASQWQECVNPGDTGCDHVWNF